MRISASTSSVPLLLLLGACGSDPASSPAAPPTGSDAALDGASDAGTSDTAATDAPPPSGFLGSILGEWKTDCRGVGGGYFAFDTLVITATRVTLKFLSYRGDSTCSNDAMKVASSDAEDAQWTVTEAFGAGFKLDRVLSKGTSTVYDKTLKDIWDRDSGCGPYTLNVEYDSSNKTCWGFWQPKPGDVYYDIVGKVGDGIALGLPESGDMKTAATRPTRLRSVIYYRKGAPSEGYIEGTLSSGKVRADKNLAAREYGKGHVQLGATTKAVTPWETWILNMPNAVGSHSCEDTTKDVYINYGFNMGSTPVLWDTKIKGGGPCTITVTKAAAAVGDTIEGTFTGTLGDGNATAPGSDTVEGGSFKLTRKM